MTRFVVFLALLALTAVPCAGGDRFVYFERALTEQDERELIEAAVALSPELTEESAVEEIRAGTSVVPMKDGESVEALDRELDVFEGVVVFATQSIGDVRVSLTIHCTKPRGTWGCVRLIRVADHPPAGGKPAYTFSRSAYFGNDGSVRAVLRLEAKYAVQGQEEPVEFMRHADYLGDRALSEVWQSPSTGFVNAWATKFLRLAETEYRNIRYSQPAGRLHVATVTLTDGIERVTGSIGACVVSVQSDTPGGPLRRLTPKCSLPEPDLSKPKSVGAGVVSVTPQGGQVEPTTAIRVMFSDDIESCMTSGWGRVLAVVGGPRPNLRDNALLTYSDSTLTLIPVDSLEYDTRYTVLVIPSQIDPACRFADKDVVWTFRTRSVVPRS